MLLANVVPAFRHTAEQADDIKGYDWEELDLRKGGRQVIRDEGNAIDITTEFVKVEGGEHGGHWAVRVKGTPRPNGEKYLGSVMSQGTEMSSTKGP